MKREILTLKNILITGSSGFIGSALRRRLLTSDHRLFEFNIEDGNIADKNALNRFHKDKIDHVFHLAGRIFVPESWDDPHAFYSTNVIGTLNSLEFCKENQCSITHISAYLYGIPKKLPIDEDAEVVPNNPYAHSKLLSEQLCQFYAQAHGLNITVFRPFNVYGIGQDKRFLIPSIIDQVLNNSEIKVQDTTPRRDYIYLEDLVDALVLSLANSRNFSIYNVGSGKSLSVGEAIEKIQTVFLTDKNVISSNMPRKSEINDTQADIHKIKRELGWEPRHTFMNGLEKIRQILQSDH
ncbi:MAG: NAD-dependent epimerase/dehydratase family protein [Calditrichales bacterium]|nr:MAG: NAD-dependent epimerase/dehydratase family protein [Calditrichales bacterium]